MTDDDDIPVLTDAYVKRTSSTVVDIEKLQAEICATSLTMAEDLLRDAAQEAEHLLVQQVLTRLREELPAIVRGALEEHLDRQAPPANHE